MELDAYLFHDLSSTRRADFEFSGGFKGFNREFKQIEKGQENRKNPSCNPVNNKQHL